MGLFSRFTFLYRVRTHAALDRLEDPRETLDYAYDQQQELLAQVRAGLIEVATAKRQLEQQIRTLQARIPQLEDQARRALELGREDLARQALERRETAANEMADLERQAAEVAADAGRARRGVPQPWSRDARPVHGRGGPDPRQVGAHGHLG